MLSVNCLSYDDCLLAKYVLNIKLYLLLSVLLYGFVFNVIMLFYVQIDFSQCFARYSLCSITRDWC